MYRVEPDESVPVTVTLNGRKVTALVRPRVHLADFLRHTLHAYGTHVGCEHGVCGACTVLLDGRPTRSCLVYAVQVDGMVVDTVEGLAQADGTLSPLQVALSRQHGLQCGFCTAGVLMSSTQFLKEHPQPTEDEIREMLSGHICRCTGYYPIISAIKEVSTPHEKKGSGK